MRLADVENQARTAESAGLRAMPIEQLRSQRGQLQHIEAQVSFVRRVAQVRLDLLLAFVESDADIGERRAEVLLAALPEIMRPASLTPHRRPAANRLAIAPDMELVEEAELAGGFDVVALSGRSDGEIADAIEAMTAFERRVSNVRGDLHRLIDDIQSEIARRYSCGELSLGA